MNAATSQGEIVARGCGEFAHAMADILHRCNNRVIKSGGYKYAGFSGFVSKHGRGFKVDGFPTNVSRGIRKQCYANALKLILSGMDVLYCEGYACANLPIPIEHAWCVTPEGVVVDNTWFPDKDKDSDYFGVAFKTDFVIAQAKLCMKHDQWCVIDQWWTGHKLLKGEYKESEWRHVW